MTTSRCWGLIILAAIVGFSFGALWAYNAGKNATEYRMREKELLFQKEKERQRKIEFAKLLIIDKRRWSDKIEQDSFDASQKRIDELDRLNMEALLNIMNMMGGYKNKPLAPTPMSPDTTE